MEFKEALKKLKEGCAVARIDFDEGDFVMSPDGEDLEWYDGFENQGFWCPSIEELEADDWKRVIFRDEKDMMIYEVTEALSESDERIDALREHMKFIDYEKSRKNFLLKQLDRIQD